MPGQTDIVGCIHPTQTVGRTSPTALGAATSPDNALRAYGALIRAIGFSLLLLALAGIMVEFALERPALRQALLADGQSQAVDFYWAARMLAYLSVAFLVACATVSLLTAVSEARLSVPPPRTSLAVLPVSEACPSSRGFVCVQRVAPCDVYPRAPPP